MHAVLVEFTVKEAYAIRFVERVRQQAKDSLTKERDCHQFDVCIDSDDSLHVMLYEIYSDQAAFMAHLESRHFKEFNEETISWIDEKRVGQFQRLG